MKKVIFVTLCSLIGGAISTVVSFFLMLFVNFLIFPNDSVDFYALSESFSLAYQDYQEKEIIASYNFGPIEFEIPLFKAKINQLGFVWSPNKKRVAYLEEIDNNTDNISDKRYSLTILNPITLGEKTIYESDYYISNWAWLDNEELIVYYHPIDEYITGNIINIKTGKTKTQQLGINYQWSADKEWDYKEWYLAYRYSNNKFGVIISNKNQKRTYEFLSEKIKYKDKIQAVWAPNPVMYGLTANDDIIYRLAAVRQKDNEDQLELLIIDFDQGMRVLTQKDLGEEGCSNMWWKNNSEYICYNSIKGRQYIHLN